MYDLVQIKKDTEGVVQEILTSRSAAWHYVGERVLIRQDGDSGNFWVRGDHANGEGEFYLKGSDLPAFSVAVGLLSSAHVKSVEEEVTRETSGSKWQKQKNG